MTKEEARKLLGDYTRAVVDATHKCKATKAELSSLRRIYRAMTGEILRADEYAGDWF